MKPRFRVTNNIKKGGMWYWRNSYGWAIFKYQKLFFIPENESAYNWGFYKNLKRVEYAKQ
jgi:hypothetical protein